MKKQLLILIALMATGASAQIQYNEIKSQKTGETRKLKIQLPRNYDSSTKQSYPVILVFDADYLFEPVAGNVDYFSYWEDMPQALVVGIMQDDREADSYYDGNSLPSESGADFFEFIGTELFPWLDKNYRITNFNLAVGHDITANFIDFYLLKSPPLFHGYISLSADLAPQMNERIVSVLNNTQENIFYYQATGSEDIKPLRDNILALNQELKSIENPNFNYFFDDFKGATHYSLAARAIPKALEEVFATYRPISQDEFQQVILKLDDSKSAYDYLVDKYETIQSLYGLDTQIRINDFIAIATALEKKEDAEGLEKLGKLAKKEYPETLMGNYYQARSMEIDGEPKKAMRAYQNSLMLKEVGNITKDKMMARAEQIKADFGY
ncbi:MAG: alpha/beta hydrolase-fold protein [Leeuwenhoekiella sp.]